MKLTKEHYDILNHTSSNGRYVTSPGGRDFNLIAEMVANGLMADYGPQRLADGAHYFTTRAAGRKVLGEYYATLLKPKPISRRKQRSKDRYNTFLRIDCGFSFAEWLMMEVRFDHGQNGWKCWSPSRGVHGEWKPTKKEAKASYKAALRERRKVKA